jgi:hypothetical protein
MKKNNQISILEIEDKAMNQRRKLLLGIGATSSLAVWHKPVVNSIMLPAHAQTSMPPTPMELCSMIVVGNTVTGPLSGTNVPPVCSVTFDVLSGTAGMPLTITAITTSALPADTTVTFDALGEATDLTGPRVVWRGPAAGAPFCLPFTPVDNVVFTVTATCGAAAGGTFSQDFNLNDII